MHVPDGFLTASGSAVTAVAATAAVGLCAYHVRRNAAEKIIPLAGLSSAFVFAGQMVNFPVAAGTSGHLLGGALAAVLVGPWLATLCISVVLAVQALIFADGGLSALGTNVVLMAVVGVWTGWLVFSLVRRLRPGSRQTVAGAAAAGALVSVPAAAGMFAVLFSLWGTAPISLATLGTAMIAVHCLIGLGEAVITYVVVSSVLAARPDIVYGAAEIDLTETTRHEAEVPA